MSRPGNARLSGFYSAGPAFGLGGTVQRACNDSAAEEEVLPKLIGSPRIQTKLTVGSADDPAEREADQMAERVMRMGAPAPPMSAAGPGVRRKCGACPPEVRPKAIGPAGGEMDTEPGTLTRGGSPLQENVRRFYEPRFGRNLGGVRVHTGAESERHNNQLNSHAFTYGEHIWMGRGQLAGPSKVMAHELAHVVQARGPPPAVNQTNASKAPARRSCSKCAQSPAGEDQLQRKCAACAGGGLCPGCSEEKKQEHFPGDGEVHRDWIDDLESGAAAVGEGISSGVGAVGEGLEAAGEGFVEGAEAVGEGIVAVGEGIAGIASEVWDFANSLASALGGVVSIVGTELVIAVPPLQICPTLVLDLPLGSIPLIDIPVFVGVLPLGEVALEGSLSLGLSLSPTISLQLGPCFLNGLGIRIDPQGPSFSAGGSVSITLGASLFAQLDAFARAQMSLWIVDPPIRIPVIGAEVGLSGNFRASGGTTLTYGAGLSYGGGSFSAGRSLSADIALGADMGIGAYGSLDVIGVEICRLYWPLWEWHGDMGMNFSLSDALSVATSGASTTLTLAGAASLSSIPYNQLPLAFDRSVLQDNCPLCDALYEAGLMPKQRGGAWTGHPAPPWMGPLNRVYPRNPGIPSGSLCRGACGSSCETCTHTPDLWVCEDMGNGCHQWWVYPNYEDCGTAAGCRGHDACYDWCAAGGETSIWGPCHRVCDFECVCDYSLPQCGGWIGGVGSDDRMVFSDRPYTVPGCRGPCPAAAAGPTAPGAPTPQLSCLDPITVFERATVLKKNWKYSTGDVVVFSMPLEIPYIPPPTLDIYVNGTVKAGIEAGIGPVVLSNLCLVYDPAAKSYSGTGELHIGGDLKGLIQLGGVLGAKAGWGCLGGVIDTEVLRGEAGITATGRAELPLDLVGRVAVSCRRGQLTLDAAALFNACLKLSFRLDAMIRVLLFKRFEIFKSNWKLRNDEWSKCWEIPLGSTSGAVAPAACGGGLPGIGPVLGDPSEAPALGPGAASAPALGPGVGGPGAIAAIAGPTVGSSSLNALDMVKDLVKMAGGKEVVHDRKNGKLPKDPAKKLGKKNPCGKQPEEEQDCANPINERREFNYRRKTWIVEARDAKHTRMATRGNGRLEEIGAERPTCDLPIECEAEFCRQVDAQNQEYGSQIGSETRDVDVYLELIEESISQQRDLPIKDQTFDYDGSASDNVGYDIVARTLTAKYRVHGIGKGVFGPKVHVEAWLFPRV